MSARVAVVCAAAVLALACGATPDAMDLSSPPLLDAGVEDPLARGGPSPGLGDAIARWDAEGKSAAASAGERACVGPAPDRALTGPEMERIFAAAFEGLLRAPRFVATRVAQGLWAGGVLKANVAELEGEDGARKIWLGEKRVERRLPYEDGGRTRHLVLRSSVANPQLVASGPAAVQRDVVILEVGARYGEGDAEAIVLVDRTARLSAVLAKRGGVWSFERSVDVTGVDETREAICRAVEAKAP